MTSEIDTQTPITNAENLAERLPRAESTAGDIGHFFERVGGDV